VLVFELSKVSTYAVTELVELATSVVPLLYSRVCQFVLWRYKGIIVGPNVAPKGPSPLVGESKLSAESKMSALNLYVILHQKLKTWKIKKFPRQKSR
jgi:hypothetical protein